jgi:hypothetical protein
MFLDLNRANLGLFAGRQNLYIHICLFVLKFGTCNGLNSGTIMCFNLMISSMRKILLLLTFILLMLMKSQAQRWERSFHLYTGAAEYTGKDAVSSHSISLFNDKVLFGSTIAPAEKGLLISAGGNLEHVDKYGLLFGIAATYEHASFKQSVTSVSNAASSTIVSGSNANGKVSLRHQYISFQPHAGFRLLFNNMKFDFVAGFEYAPCISSDEKGNVTRLSDNKQFVIDSKRTRPAAEIRYAFRSTLFLQKTGLTIGYAKALSNAYAGYIGGDPEAFAQFLRIGFVRKF